MQTPFSLTRRSFLWGASAFALPSLGGLLDTEPRLRIGVLSDIHIGDQQSADVFVHALEYFRSRKVDGVLIAGDMADNGLVEQLQKVGAAWTRVFPDNRGADGRTVEKLFITGNHDIDGCGWSKDYRRCCIKDEYRSRSIVADPVRVWRDVFDEEYAPIVHKRVKGYDFIGANWYQWSGVQGVEEYFKEHAAEFHYDRPFFYYQHPHPKDTCHGAFAWGHDDGRSTRALSAFPNAVAFSGHSHHPLSDERAVWQGAFTSIGTASLLNATGGFARENTPFWKGVSRDVQMMKLDTNDGKQGMVMSVYDSAIVLERRSFVFDLPMGDDWVIPWPPMADKPFEPVRRMKVLAAPAFAEDAKLSIRVSPGERRDRTWVDQVKVSFPAATAGARAYEYDVKVESLEYDLGRMAAHERVMAADFHLPPSRANRTNECRIDRALIPDASSHRVTVTPLDSFGTCGRPLVATLRIGHGAVFCEGVYPERLQGAVAADKAIFWSFGTVLVKTDREGHVLSSVSIPASTGDICVCGGLVYLAVRRGALESWIFAYSTDRLELREKFAVPEITGGISGIVRRGDGFTVIGEQKGDASGISVCDYAAGFSGAACRQMPLNAFYAGRLEFRGRTFVCRGNTVLRENARLQQGWIEPVDGREI